MKVTKILITGAVLCSVAVFGQKDELKVLKKIYGKDTPTQEDIATFKSTLAKLEPIATEEADKVYTKFFKAMLPMIEMSALGPTVSPDKLASLFTPEVISSSVAVLNETLDYEKKTGKKVYTDDINETITAVKPQLLNAALAYEKSKKYTESAQLLYALYQLDKTDTDKLYYAANYAVNGQNYDLALKYYTELKNINYTGEKTLFYAVNKATNQEEYFDTNKTVRDMSISAGSHIKPRDEKVTSKKGEIYKNISLILIQQGKASEAKAAIVEARKANPDDVSLIVSEADIYLQEKDFTNYTRVVNEALEKNPNSVDLVFNLGVISADSGKVEDAEKYYRKAMEIDPNYFNAYLNLAELKLRADKDFVAEMNKLGNTQAEIKKFDAIRAKQIANYQEVMPILEKAVELNPTNEPASKTLLSVYRALDLSDKAKALKEKMKS